MPIYAYTCEACGHRFEAFNTIDERHAQTCEECEASARIRLTPIPVHGDIEPYESIVTGEMITSRREHRRHLQEHGLVEVGNEEPETVKEKKYRMKHGEPGDATIPEEHPDEPVADAPFEWQEPNALEE